MSDPNESRRRLRNLTRTMDDDDIDKYGPKGAPIVKAARDMSRVKQVPATGDTKGPGTLRKAVSTANPFRGATDRTAKAINEHRSRSEEIQRAIDNE